MLSLGVSKGGVIPPTDEDRRRIIKQMKVRTTLKGDKSWIHHHNSDSEDEEKKSSSLAGRAGGGSPASKPSTPQSNRSPASKPQSGYLIRGVFTRTIDKTSSTPDSSNEAQKSCSSTPKGPSSGRPSSGYRMTTEDYKKLAPYNVKQKSVDLDEEDVPFTADEHKKRTEAANSVLRRTASRERAYVLSAAKKSNGSPTQEFPPMFAKRIEIEEEEGQQRRSSAVSGSCRLTPDDNSTNGLRKTTAGSSWNEPKPTTASPSGKSQTTPSLSETSERIPTAAEIRNGENRQVSTGKCSPEAASQHGEGEGTARNVPKPVSQTEAKCQVLEKRDKPPKELPEPFPRDELAPRAAVVATNGSYPAHTEANNGFYSPKSHSGHRDGPTDATDKLHHPFETSHRLDDAEPEPARSSLQSDVPSPPTETAPVHLEDTEHSFKGSALGSEERSSTQESGYPSGEAAAYSKPRWSEAMSSPGFTPGEGWQESTRASDGCKPELSQEGFLDSTNHTEKGQKPSDHVVHPEPPRLKEHHERDPSMTRITPAYEEQTRPTTESHPESPGDWRHAEPSPVAASRSNFSSQESALGAYEAQHPMPLYTDRQPFNASVPAPSHRIPAYVDSQVFSTRRAAPDYEGRSSPRSSAGAWGHCEFHPAAERHDSLPRDTPASVSPRSHRVPFYMDTLNYNSTRLLSGSSERICAHNSPVASGYQPDSSAAGRGVLFVKEYVNTGGFSASPRHGSGSLVDLTDLERATYGHHSYLSSAPLHRSSEPVCSYCSREIRDCPKIIIEHLNIYCHEYCFRCGICHKAMGDLLDKIFIHRDIVHCDKCYEKLF